MTAIDAEHTRSDAGRDDTVHESGSYDSYGVNPYGASASQPGYESWSVASDPQAVPHPRTGTGFAVGPTMSIPAVPSGGDPIPILPEVASYSAQDGTAGQTQRATPYPRPHVTAGIPEASEIMVDADVSRETEDPPLAQEAKRAVEILN